MAGQTYEVRVRGPIPPNVLAQLGAHSLVEEPAQTVLRTEPIDQAELHGILCRLQDFGLDLIEIRTSLADDRESDGNN
jgi:hypothetical protein